MRLTSVLTQLAQPTGLLAGAATVYPGLFAGLIKRFEVEVLAHGMAVLFWTTN
jgi:hypothetical protein